MLIAPYFGLIFGDGWARAGELAIWLAPMFALRFVASPISMVMHVVGRQRDMMLLSFAGLAARIGAVFAALWIFDGFIVETYAVVSALVYGLYMVIFLKFAQIQNQTDEPSR